ncbi:MAG TPA: gamma-glutamyltransferase [Sedimenticola thiotaurini]|uniref:Gamma-glutamyltransferase n=1 Tax=Sedimenticola thiotaurini TaxID=1543721 RepID=A0A831RHX1_9GAMM|nr:gamma-glutamyltransferase [Sedimenticola thiotaurini]
MFVKGITAAGHSATAQAAADILQAGGNAFDAVLAALFASCVAEPVLASLGGGGFLLARPHGGRPVLYDFFTQTPGRKRPAGQVDFYPIVADFGTAQQEFHIGMGSIATPGVVRGLFRIHRDLCRLPLRSIVEPALDLARAGVPVNPFQHYIAEIVSPILLSTPAALALHRSPGGTGLAAPGERVPQPQMADAFDALTREGEGLFYQGEIGRRLVDDCDTGGGHLRMQDLEGYRVRIREPLHRRYHGFELFTNPPPSIGGTLIAFTLALLEQESAGGMSADSAMHLAQVADAQRLTQRMRRDQRVEQDLDERTAERLLGHALVQQYRRQTRDRHRFARGTTQISIADRAGNLASMTLSNGEGSGYVIPETGIMMNNMLGEEDINPHGFHHWPENRRIASMMSPTLLLADDGRAWATGSGGSNRIRSAILQVLLNLVDFDMDIEQAVEHPRIHYENGLLNIESGFPNETLEELFRLFPEHRLWPEKNLFFGGAHTVSIDTHGTLSGQGDSRRGGVAVTV